MEVIYGRTFNRYPRDWSSYFYTLPMVSNELHWCLLNLLVKSLQNINYSSMVLQYKITANVVF